MSCTRTRPSSARHHRPAHCGDAEVTGNELTVLTIVDQAAREHAGTTGFLLRITSSRCWTFKSVRNSGNVSTCVVDAGTMRV